MEVGLRDHGVYKSSRFREDNNISDEVRNGNSRVEKVEKKQNDDVMVEINDGNGGSQSCEERSKAEKLCRICHFGDDELVSLGCDCRGELGFSHRNCARLWFSQKGNRVCEICGKTAKNISNDDDDDNNEAESARLRMEVNEIRLVIEAVDSSNESSQRCKISFCNFLLGCLLLAFVLPWFIRGIDML